MLAAVVLLTCAPLFEDVTVPAGLEGVKGDRFCFADIDRDGDPDLIVAGRRLFLNEGGRFVESKGALKGARGSSATCIDVDGDGRLDVITLGGDLFLQQRDGSFRHADLEWPARQASFGAADIDGDGLPELVTTGGERWKDNRSFLFPRTLLRNLGGGKFKSVAEKAAFRRPVYGRSAVFADFDDDGDADLFLGNYRLAANELFVNDKGALTDQAAARGCRGVGRRHENSPEYFGHTIGASWADLDDDGWIDLWVSNLVHKYYGPSARGSGFDVRGKICDDSNLYRNTGPPDFRFVDRRKESGIAIKPVGGRDAYRGDELWSNCACADFDNDGDLDVFVTQVYTLPYSHSFLFRNEGGFRFKEADAGFRIFAGYGGAWADVDGDGRMDLVTGGALNEPKAPRQVRLWRNKTRGGAWIAFRMPPGALGAVVRVLTDTKVLTRTVEATMGSHAQKNDDLLHFGLGEESVKEVWISWPGGVLQRKTAVAPKRVHKLKRPAARPRALSLEVGGTEIVCKPALAGARYLWDFDDDFRTDAVTKENHVSLPEGHASKSVCVRVLKGTVGGWARARVGE